MLLPIRRRVLLIVALKRGVVVLRVVAEHRAAGFEPASVANQNVPVVVANLMSEVPEQAAIGLGKFRAALFDLRAIGFRKRDRHHAVVMAGHDFRSRGVGRVGQEFERQPMLRVLGASLQRELPAKQAIEQPVLGEFDVPPGDEMRRFANIRDRVVVAAGGAKSV